jgi:hypothetical protein
MTSIRALIGLLPWLALAALPSAIGCSDDEETHHGVPACTPGDPVTGLSCDCTGAECVCPSAGDCAIHCVDACSLQCAGSGSCIFDCAEDCQVACTGSGNCTVDVGPGSTVDCTGSGDCDVDCLGDCDVSCPGSATCTVHCLEGSICTLENCPSEVAECPNGVSVCNGACG